MSSFVNLSMNFFVILDSLKFYTKLFYHEILINFFVILDLLKFYTNSIILPPRVVSLVVKGSLLRVWKVKVLGSNLAMRSVWEITSYSWFMLTSIFDKAGYTAMTYLDPLL